MLFFLFLFSGTLTPYNELGVKILLSGARSKKDPFLYQSVPGFHFYRHQNFEILSKFREKYVLLSFTEHNETMYSYKHCSNLLMSHKDLQKIKKRTVDKYYNIFVGNDKSYEVTEINASDQNGYTNNEFFITISNNKIDVVPINSFKIDDFTPGMFINITFLLKIDGDPNKITNKEKQVEIPNDLYPPGLTTITICSFIIALILCTFFSMRDANINAVNMNNFYRVSFFIQNTLLFSFTGLTIAIQITLYYFIINLKALDDGFHFIIYTNMVFLASIVPTVIRIYISQLLNLEIFESDVVAIPIAGMFFVEISYFVLSIVTSIFFSSFRFQSVFYIIKFIIIYLLLMLVSLRGVFRITIHILSQNYKLPFYKMIMNEKNSEGHIHYTNQNKIQMPNVLYLILYGIIITLILLVPMKHIMQSALNCDFESKDSKLNFYIIYRYFILYLSFASICSTFRTSKRLTASKDSWMEDHILYNLTGGFFVGFYMIYYVLFIQKIASFEMLLNSAALIYAGFGIIFLTGTGSSFITCFIQSYFVVLKKHINNKMKI